MNLYDYRRPCPKCANTVVDTKFVREGENEYMRRTCGRCTATWNERALDDVTLPMNRKKSA
jgi:ribosomal protein S27AE